MFCGWNSENTELFISLPEPLDIGPFEDLDFEDYFTPYGYISDFAIILLSSLASAELWASYFIYYIT